MTGVFSCRHLADDVGQNLFVVDVGNAEKRRGNADGIAARDINNSRFHVRPDGLQGEKRVLAGMLVPLDRRRRVDEFSIKKFKLAACKGCFDVADGNSLFPFFDFV